MAVPSTLVDTVSTQLEVLPDMSDTSVRDMAAGVCGRRGLQGVGSGADTDR